MWKTVDKPSSAFFLQPTCKPAEMEKLMENDVFKAFATYAAIVSVKMLLMGPMTGYFRITRGVGNSNICWNKTFLCYFKNDF